MWYVGLFRVNVIRRLICVQYTTTWDRKSLFTYTNLGPNPINFGKPGATGQADIVVNDNQGYQAIWGHGGALSTPFM